MLVNRIHKPYLCNICKKATGVKACKCQKAFYCSRNCQKIDWNVHKSDCLYKFTDPRAITTKKTNNSTDPNNTSHDILLQEQQQQRFTNSDNATLMQQTEQQHERTITLDRERRTYDPTPLQYQQPHVTYTPNTFTTTSTHIQHSTSTSNEAVDDFEENLFNSLMYSVVNESTEQEILKNLNIRADDLLTTYSLDSDISSSLNDTQSLKEYVPNLNSVDQTLSDKIFNQEAFEIRPETQKLLAETKETLEKELSLFCENNLNEKDQMMQLGTTNPKYVTHTKVQDNNVMRTPDEQMALEEMSCTLIRDLNEYGVCVLDSFVGEERGLKVLEEVKCMYKAGLFRDGQLVSTTKSKLDHKHIRSDKIMWVDGKEQGLYNIKYLMNQVDAVITLANRMRNNGKLGQYNIRERTKAMVAVYEGKGSHYVKHVDNPNKDGRCITCIYYLNVNWNVQESGGLLRIFPDGWVDRIADIEPIFDRITFFWSDRRNPHEVQPAHRTRYAITLWYFDAHEREAAVRKYKKDCENLLKAA
ncbi:hypothetical protein PVAND_000674 [Polypedilum vanderplanki]|uniref:hypoxia-inducible factor-proline dioxygenase n=1 Tax=Polypedilum vanderplanki TaxID=319348 RepID=A0A9J6BM02_POLVA|nr:hypothetical protein PVAND_000674 [Polypedilum vanderplanki]